MSINLNWRPVRYRSRWLPVVGLILGWTYGPGLAWALDNEVALSPDQAFQTELRQMERPGPILRLRDQVLDRETAAGIAPTPADTSDMIFRLSSSRQGLYRRLLAPETRGLAAQMAAVTSNALAVTERTETGAVVEAQSDDLVTTTPAKQKMYEALFNVQDKEYETAIPKLEWVIQEDPSLLPAWESLGWSYWAVGRKEDAKKLWEKLLTLAPNEPLAYNCLALVASERGEMAKAIAYYQKSLELDPNQYETRFAYYQTLVWQGQLDQAIPGLRDLLKQDPDRMDIRLALARALLANQDYEESLTHWTLICKQIPDNAEFALTLARNLLYIGDLELATEEAQRALELDENNNAALTLLADIAEFSNKPEDAIQELQKVVDRTEDQIFRSRLIRRQALLLRDLNETNPAKYPLTKCIAVTREAVKLDPRAVTMQLFLGEILLMDKQYGAAQEVFDTILKEINPHNLRAKNGLFEIALARGQWDEADRRLQDVLADFNPLDPYRYFQMARLEYARGNYYDALTYLDRLEEEGARGAVFVLLYHALSPSEWMAEASARRFREHLQALQRADFKFVTPDQIPAYFKARNVEVTAVPQPVLYRMWRWIKYGFTGTGKPAPPSIREYRPEKMACVTFDDAMRSTLLFGTPIAEEMHMRFGLVIPVGNLEQHQIGLASWDELRRYAKTGCWSYGSHLLNASYALPVDETGYLANSLPNRIWDPIRNRPETTRAYFDRIRKEFKGSREKIIKELNMDKDECRFVAYPFGDLGQEVDCNLTMVDNPSETLLNEAHMNYDVGFIQGAFGYALKGDNPLLYQRYEPSRRAEGREILQAAFENHPVFLARRMRAEIAALNGKLYLAQEMLKELERDGYPDEALSQLSTYVKESLAGVYEDPQIKSKEQRKKQRLISFNQPFVGIEAGSTRANVQLEQWDIMGRAGLNLNPRLTVSALGGYANIKQEITSNTWVMVETTKVTVTRSTTVTHSDTGNTYSDETITTYDPVQISTNIQTKRNYKSDEDFYGARLNYRFGNGSLLSGEMTQRSYSGDITNDTEALCGAAEYQWKPVLALDSVIRYEHDVIPSAYRLLTYDAAALAGFWRVTDWWDISGRGRYAFLSDKNSLLNLNFDTSWLIAERAGVYFGLLASFINADKYNADYWTPYWEQRYFIYAKIQRAYPRFFGDAQVRLGEIKDKARDADVQAYQARKAQGDREGWYPGENPDKGFGPAVGASASLRAKWGRLIELFGTASVDALPDYTEYNLRGGATCTF